MKATALFEVLSVLRSPGGSIRVRLKQVDDPNDTGMRDLRIDGLTITVRNPALAEFLKPGRQFRMTLTPADLVLVATTDSEE